MLPDGVPYCAVSADGCDEESVFLKPLELKAQTNHECFVCMATTVPLGEEVAATVEETEEIDIVQDLEKEIFGADMSTTASSSSIASAGMVIGVAIGSVALVTFLVSMLLFYQRKQRKLALEKGTSVISYASKSTVSLNQQRPPMDLEVDDNKDVVSDIGEMEDRIL